MGRYAFPVWLFHPHHPAGFTGAKRKSPKDSAIKITPVRDPELEGVAIIHVWETKRDPSYNVRVVNQIASFSNRRDAATHLDKSFVVAVGIDPSLGI